MYTRSHETGFTKVPAKVPHIHQSSGEGAFCVRAAFRICPRTVGDIEKSFWGEHNFKRVKTPLFGIFWTHVLSGVRWLKVA